MRYCKIQRISFLLLIAAPFSPLKLFTVYTIICSIYPIYFIISIVFYIFKGENKKFMVDHIQ